MSKQTVALKLALEQTLEMLIDNREYIEANERAEYLAMYDKAIAGAEKALAEQPAPAAQQEPVACFIRGGVKGARGEDYAVEFFGGKPLPPDGALFYTTPQAQPSREWVGLTEEEKTELRRKHYPLPLLLMDATEAKLKEKNHD